MFLKAQSGDTRADFHPTHHRRGPISNLLVLQISQFTQNFSSWVLHLQQLQNGCPIVGDGHVLQDENLVFTHAHTHTRLWNVILTPMSSTNILSRPTGPRELLTMFAIDAAAMTAQIIKMPQYDEITLYPIEEIMSDFGIFCHFI